MILALCLLSVSVAGLAITAMILHHDRGQWKWYHDFWKDSYNNCANDSALLRNEVSELKTENARLTVQFAGLIKSISDNAISASKKLTDLTRKDGQL